MDCRSGDLSCVKNYRKVGKSKTIEGEKMLKKKKIYIPMSLVIAVILFCILFFSGKIHYIKQQRTGSDDRTGTGKEFNSG